MFRSLGLREQIKILLWKERFYWENTLFSSVIKARQSYQAVIVGH